MRNSHWLKIRQLCDKFGIAPLLVIFSFNIFLYSATASENNEDLINHQKFNQNLLSCKCISGLSAKNQKIIIKDSICATSKNYELNNNPLSNYLRIEAKTTVDSLYQWKHLSESGDIVLEKLKGHIWYSSAKHNFTEITPEGDVRIPIAVFGAELAYEMGFRIESVIDPSTGNEKIIIRVPGFKKINEFIRLANEELKEAGQEPISYKLFKSGLLQSSEFLDITLDVNGDYLLQFPFDDANVYLTAHEISFHLAAIMLPRKILFRTKAISELTRKLTFKLADFDAEMNGKAKLIIDVLKVRRSEELDFGTGNLGLCIAGQTIPGFFNNIFDTLIVGQSMIQKLANPELSPLRHVLENTSSITKLESIGLNPEEKDLLEKILSDFAKEEASYNDEAIYEISTSITWFDEFKAGLPARRIQILKAAQRAKRQQASP